MKKFLYQIFIVLVMSSCVSKEQTMLSSFPLEYSVVLQELSIEKDSIRNPYLMGSVADKLFFVNRNMDKLVSMFDLKSGNFIGDFISKGVGPNELLFISSISSAGKQLAVFDATMGSGVMQYYTVNYDGLQFDSEIDLPNHSEELISAFNGISLADDGLMVTGLTSSRRLIWIDMQGKVWKSFGDYPDDEEKSCMEKGFAYQCFMTYSFFHKVLAVGNCFGEGISFYDLQNKSAPLLLAEYIGSSPKYKPAQDGVIFDRENILGVVEMESTPDYCVVLYRGKSYFGTEYGGDKLLFFDWNGQPVTIVPLDQVYKNMAYDEENNRLILLGISKEHGDYRVVAIDMSLIC